MVRATRRGGVTRSFRITRAEMVAVQTSAAGIPPGCTVQEWESGQAVMYGMSLDSGQIMVQPDTRLLMKLTEETRSLIPVETLLTLRSGEWTGTPPTITVSAATLTAIHADPRRVGQRDGKIITSITAGVVVWQ